MTCGKAQNFHDGVPLEVQVIIEDDRYTSQWELPKYETGGSAAMDLRAATDEAIVMVPGSTRLIPTGLRIHIKRPGWAGVILPRSGLGHKNGVVLGNGTGLIDSDYQGPLMVSLTNRNTSLGPFEFVNSLLDDPVVIQPGDRIAQLMFVPVARASFNVVESFSDESERGDGGFGSTGVTDA